VLAPRPSYPLFEHLGRLDAVTIIPYDLEYHGRAWSIDVASVERALSDRTRALLVVTPNNPTGSFVKSHELDRLAAICAARGVALIADEVFADYELVPGASRSSGRVLPRQDVLAFSLGGLSKSIGLPQVKLGWIGIGGPTIAVEHALARLEVACDTYLSVSTPVQLAAPELLDRGASLRRQIQARVTANYNYLAATGAARPACEVLNAEGGWYAIVRVPSLCPEEELVLNLLADADVLTHPGYFFDFAYESHLIVSLLVSENLFRDGVSHMFRYFESSGGQA
jgi:aspartate/methionine/tyrosine aminotransferase